MKSFWKFNAPQGEIPVGLNNENKKHDSSQGEHIEGNVHGAALIHTAANMFLPVLPCLVIVSFLNEEGGPKLNNHPIFI